MRSPLCAALAVGLAVVAGLAIALPGRASEESSVESELAELRAVYMKAFEAGDAEAISRCFAPDAEYVGEAGAVHEGREAIRDLVAAFLEENPGVAIESRSEKLRILGAGAAMRTGANTYRNAAGEVIFRTRFAAVFSKLGERWFIANLREALAEPLTARERLEPLAFMIGDWMEETDEVHVESTCRWAEDGPFLVQTFTVRIAGGEERSAMQRIGWDAQRKKVRSWIWESDGGFGGALWTRAGDEWVLQSFGVSAEGVQSSGVHRIRRHSEDIIQWDSTERILGDSVLEDVTHTIVRQPGAEVTHAEENDLSMRDVPRPDVPAG